MDFSNLSFSCSWNSRLFSHISLNVLKSSVPLASSLFPRFLFLDSLPRTSLQPSFTPALVEGRSSFSKLVAPAALSSLSLAPEEMICGILWASNALGRRTFNFHLGGIYTVTVAFSLVKNTVIRKGLLDFIQALFASFTCFDL